jgi:hypothetical protein
MVEQHPYREVPPPAPSAPRPNLDHLGYGDRLAMPGACVCCLEPTQTTAETDQVMTGTRSVSWFRFPTCKRCRWHMTMSGRFKTGLVDRIGFLFFGAGLVGGIALGLTGEQPNPGNAAVYAVVFGIAGYLACMALVALLGLAIAPRKRECTCRGAAVRIRRGNGVWHFRFTNPRFEDAFRAMNRGFAPIAQRPQR